MALLGTFINAGIASLASGLTCFAHGIQGFATPDWADYQVRSMGAVPASVPIALESLGATFVIFRNGNGGGVNGNMLVVLFHGIIR